MTISVSAQSNCQDVYIYNIYSNNNGFFFHYNKTEGKMPQIFDQHTSPSSGIIPKLFLDFAI